LRLTLKLLILFFSILLNVQTVHALAVAQPIPSNVTLKRGESLPITFQIQAITSSQDQLCTYSFNGLNPLKFSFEKEEAVVEAGNKLNVFGTVEIPSNAPLKSYEGELVVNCKPKIEGSGVSVIGQVTSFPFYVRVEKSEKTEDGKSFILLLIMVLVLAVVIWLSKFRKNQKSIIDLGNKEEKQT
jgi:hypothetical protein